MSEPKCITCAGIRKELRQIWEWTKTSDGSYEVNVNAVSSVIYHKNGDMEAYRNTIVCNGCYYIKMNYCPECGASIKKRIREWKREEDGHADAPDQT